MAFFYHSYFSLSFSLFSVVSPGSLYRPGMTFHCYIFMVCFSILFSSFDSFYFCDIFSMALLERGKDVFLQMKNRALLGQGPVVWRDLERCAAGREKPPETCWRQYVLMITFIVVTSLAKHLQIVIYRPSALRPPNDMIALHFIVCIFLIDAIFSQ